MQAQALWDAIAGQAEAHNQEIRNIRSAYDKELAELRSIVQVAQTLTRESERERGVPNTRGRERKGRRNSHSMLTFGQGVANSAAEQRAEIKQELLFQSEMKARTCSLWKQPLLFSQSLSVWMGPGPGTTTHPSHPLVHDFLGT